MPKTIIGPFARYEIEAAEDQLRPHVEKLVERFGETQAWEIILHVCRQECLEGMYIHAEVMRQMEECGALNDDDSK
jgi:hypothetical protein